MKTKFKVKLIFDENGNKTGVLMAIKEFKKLLETLEDLNDLKTTYERINKNFKPIPYEKIRKELFGYDTKK